MKIAFRLDDITPDMNMIKFQRAYEIFTKADIKPLVGIVPDCQDSYLHYEDKKSDFWDLMRMLQRKGWMVAQHGYQHTYITKESGLLGINPFSEFAGLPFEVQLDKLKKGNEILKINGVESKIFMAPGHTYDKNTIRALKQCGFKYITDGYTKYNVNYQNICFVPCRNEKESNKKGVNTICLHPNLMEESDFMELENKLQNNNGRYVDFQILLETKVYDFSYRCVIDQWWALKKYFFRLKIGNSKIAQKYFAKCNHSHSWMRKVQRIIYAPMLIGIFFEKRTSVDNLGEG